MQKLPDRIKMLFIKNREVISYLFFGGLTTLVNFLSYAMLHELFSIDKSLSNGIAWFVSVIFAFFTNKKYVFKDKSSSLLDLSKKLLSFFGFRALSGVFDIVAFNALVPYINDYLLKILISVFVIIANYVFSKFLIFRKKFSQKS
ncbi:MAG: GtrA family protein [Clostridiales bacterium]|nr:GtrA family protein [Clostridiales bacterium]